MPVRAGSGSKRSDAIHMAKCGNLTLYYCRTYGKLGHSPCDDCSYVRMKVRKENWENGLETLRK